VVEIRDGDRVIPHEYSEKTGAVYWRGPAGRVRSFTVVFSHGGRDEGVAGWIPDANGEMTP
jgi:hypothetical protein